MSLSIIYLQTDDDTESIGTALLDGSQDLIFPSELQVGLKHFNSALSRWRVNI